MPVRHGAHDVGHHSVGTRHGRSVALPCEEGAELTCSLLLLLLTGGVAWLADADTLAKAVRTATTSLGLALSVSWR